MKLNRDFLRTKWIVGRKNCVLWVLTTLLVKGEAQMVKIFGHYEDEG
jgi:hypothetical protein